MSKRYGIPMQGSKNRLAERIVDLLPTATHLYDVFAGGGAISHCALLSGKWKCVHISDATNSVELFRDFLEGNVPDGSEWISREEFYRRIDDPYVRIIWSWSNNQRDYIYSKELEPYKKAVHEMIYAPTPNERRLKFREVCRLLPFLLGAGVRTGDIQSMERSQKLYTDCKAQRIPPPTLRSVNQAVTPPRFSKTDDNRNELGVNGANHGKKVFLPFCHGEYEIQVCDYRDVEILPDSIVYADPPYARTRGYGKDETFDHEAFNDWVEEQTVPVFISEYDMPHERFKSVAEYERVSSFSATNNNKREIEKIFIPRKWSEWWESIKVSEPKQLSLFDDM